MSRQLAFCRSSEACNRRPASPAVSFPGSYRTQRNQPVSTKEVFHFPIPVFSLYRIPIRLPVLCYLLEAAIVLKQDPALMNNLGIAYAQQGNVTKAREMLDKAQVRKEAKFNMGLILMQQGDYAKAVNYLKGMPSVYLAYSQLKAGDNRAAMDTFKQLKLKNATEYYLMAVAAARVKDTSAMEQALQKAFQMNPGLKKQADLKF